MSVSFNYEKAMSLDWNGQVFVLTIRNETNMQYQYLYSNDGKSWSANVNDLSNSALLSKSPYNVHWLGTNFAVVGNLTTSSGNTILRSVDGTVCSGIPINTGVPLYDIEANLEFPHTITFPRNMTLALGGNSTNSTKIAYSTDEGITWMPSSNSADVFSTTANNAVWNGRTWVAVGAGTNTIAVSHDATIWIGRGNYIFTTAGYGIAWSNEQAQWVAGGAGTNSLAYSSDGAYWFGLGNTVLSTVYDVQWNGSIWVAAGVPITGNKSLAYSYDGRTWALPTQTNLFDISASKVQWNGVFWTAIGSSSAENGSSDIATSSDGVVWQMQNNAAFNAAPIKNIYSNAKTPITLFTS